MEFVARDGSKWSVSATLIAAWTVQVSWFSAPDYSLALRGPPGKERQAQQSTNEKRSAMNITHCQEKQGEAHCDDSHHPGQDCRSPKRLDDNQRAG